MLGFFPSFLTFSSYPCNIVTFAKTIIKKIKQLISAMVP